MRHRFIWTPDIVRHLGKHSVSPEEFEYVFSNPNSKGVSRSTGLPVIWGYLPDGRYIMIVFEWLDAATVLPVTAYEVPEPG